MNPIPVYSENIVTYTDTNIEELCCICLEDINTQPIHALNECNHKFHSSCLIESLRTNSGCPLCRGRSVTIKTGNVFRHILSFCKSKKNNSKKLKNLVKNYERAKDVYKTCTNEYKIFRNTNKELFKQHGKLRTKRWNTMMKFNRIKREISMLPIAAINKKT